MSDLTVFLLARIAEDEAQANALTDALENIGGGSGPDWHASDGRLYVGHAASIFDSKPVFARFVARHDPARVLAECEAKRRIVEETRFSDDPQSEVDYWLEPGRRDLAPGPRVAALTGVLKILAAVYAGHPDFRDEWKP